MTPKYAKVGMFLLDDKNHLYGLVNRHFTLQTDGDIFNINLEKFGKRASLVTHTNRHDVDVIEIHEEFRWRLCSTLHQPNGHTRKCAIFGGDIHDVYGKEVFKYKNIDCNNESIRTSKRGIILTKTEHQALSRFIGDKDVEFLVNGKDGLIFAEPGESGTAIAIDDGNGNIEIVGIIQGGDSETADISSYTRCLFVPRLISYLNELHRTHFELMICQRFDCLDAIHFGDTVLIKSPDQIALEDFDLCNKLIVLFNTILLDDANLDRLLFVKSKEIELSAMINDRQCIETKDDNSPEQGALFNSMLACQFIYNGQFRESEACFKICCRHILQSNEFRYRILFKMITYVSFLFCNRGDKINHWKLLTEVRETLNGDDEIVDSPGFPVERLGYIPYEFAKYHRKDNNRCDAMIESYNALTMFKEAFETKKSDDTANRLVLGVCEYINIALWVGKSTEQDIQQADVRNAQEQLNLVERLIDENRISSVQYVDFLLCKSDLEYRTGNKLYAKKLAKDALDISSRQKITSSQEQAEKRLSTIEKKSSRENNNIVDST